MGKDGIELGPRGVGVAFDIDADGEPEMVQWVRRSGDEAFPVLDRNGNGIVDDGSELFGNHTPIELDPGHNAAHGFDALAQYDDPRLGGNGDGYITKADRIWWSLRLWNDSNADGVSTPDEISTLRDNDVVSLPTTASWRRNMHDPAGNLLPLWGVAESQTSPHRMSVVDVFFVILN